jgi:hypothetical protein
MSFPISPTNGQLATVNGIVFSYNSASFSWTRTASALSGVADLVVTNNANLTNIYSSVGNFTGNLIAAGIVGTIYYGQINLGTTSVNLNRTSGSQVLTGVGIDGTAATATNAINTQITSNISSGTAYVSFVNSTAGNVAQNVNTSLTYNPNSGNLRAYGIQTDTGVYWAGNGVAFSSAPGGTTGQLQYNNNNLFTGANIVFNNTNGNLVITSTTNSSSDTTGALVVRGGAGIAGNVTFGGNSTHAGKFIINEATNSEPYIMGSGAFYVAGGMSIGKDFWVGGNLYVANVISQTSEIIQVNDPLVYLRGNNNPYNYDIGVFSDFTGGSLNKSQFTGAVRSYQSNEWVFFSNIDVAPAAGIVGLTNSKIIYDPVKVGNLLVANTTVSTSSSTGALIVRGGAGFAANIFTAGWIIPTSNVSQNLGSSTAWWNLVYGKSIQAQYADLAENYGSDQDYPPGTVVVFGGDKEITTTNLSHDTRVAGVISSNPAYLMNANSNGLPVAFTGRVPCQVRGPVNQGTVLVSSQIPGVAEAINLDLFKPGCVIGKSLEAITTNEIKTIEVAVGRF